MRKAPKAWKKLFMKEKTWLLTRRSETGTLFISQVHAEGGRKKEKKKKKKKKEEKKHPARPRAGMGWWFTGTASKNANAFCSRTLQARRYWTNNETAGKKEKNRKDRGEKREK